MNWSIENCAARLVERQRAARRDPRLCESLEERAAADGEPGSVDGLAELAAPAERDDVELHIDVTRAIDALPAPLRRLCRELSVFSVSEVARRRGISRRALARDMKAIRKHFFKASLTRYAYPYRPRSGRGSNPRSA